MLFITCPAYCQIAERTYRSAALLFHSKLSPLAPGWHQLFIDVATGSLLLLVIGTIRPMTGVTICPRYCARSYRTLRHRRQLPS